MDYKNIKKIIAVVLVIAVIIGIIIGFRYAFTPPCVRTDYIRYTDYDNVCGPQCTGDKKAMPIYDDNKKVSSIICCDTYICKDKNSEFYNKCVPSGLCNNKDFNLIENEDNCNCKKDCSNNSNYPKSFPDTGVNMKKLSDGSYIPQDYSYCGFDCSYDEEKYCSLDKNNYIGEKTTKELLCGQQTFKNGPGYSGCFNPDEYESCNDDNGLVCAKNNCGDNDLCKSASCPPGQGYVCSKDGDCQGENPDDDKYYTCNMKNEKLLSKGIKDIGVCVYDNGKDKTSMKTNSKIFDYDMCSDIDDISYRNGHGKIGFWKCNPKDTKMCTDNTDNKCVGSNLDLNCESKDPCTKFGLCGNGWQAKTENGKNCSMNKVGEANQLCCDEDHLADVLDKKGDILTCNTTSECGTLGSCVKGECKYCCNKEGTKINGKTLCANTTEYGYSKGLLGGSTDMDEKIKCTYDSDCINKYNNDLYENLGISNPTPDNMNYSTLYCDPKEKVCKAMCGYLNHNNNNNPPFLTDDVSKYIKNSVDKTSFCYQKATGCTLTNQVFNNGTINTIPICKSIEPTGDTRLWWSKDINKDSKREYNTSFHMDFKATDDNKNQSCSSDKGSGLCLALAKGIEDVQKIHITDTGNGGKCTFDINCLNDNFFITDTDTSNDTNNLLKWKDLSNPVISKDGLLNLKNNPQSGPAFYNTPQKISQSITQQTYPYNTCEGNSHGFDDELTFNMYERDELNPDDDKQWYCKNKVTKTLPQLLYTGEYCKNGVDFYNDICINDK